MTAKCLSDYPPGKTRKQENFSAFWQFLRPGVAIDRPVDGNGDASVDQGLESGILFSQLPEQLPYVLGLDLDLVLASGGRGKRRRRELRHRC
jgi:hypothetical protein